MCDARVRTILHELRDSFLYAFMSSCVGACVLVMYVLGVSVAKLKLKHQLRA